MSTAKREATLKKRRRKYARNVLEERRLARTRARQRAQNMSAEERQTFLEQRRQAQARYRERNREALALKSRQYRAKAADVRSEQLDAEILAEFDAMMKEGLLKGDDFTFEVAAARLYRRTGKRYKV